MSGGGRQTPGGEIYLEFVVQGAFVKVTAVDGTTGLEACIVGPASAGRETLSAAALRKLDYVRRNTKS